jgi:hypothetical protein
MRIIQLVACAAAGLLFLFSTAILQAQPIGAPRLCSDNGRVSAVWSDYMFLKYTETVTGPQVDSKFEFSGQSRPIVQTLPNNRCDSGKTTIAREYTNIRFFMTRKYIWSNPEQDFPAYAQLSEDFKSYIDPVKSQLGGPTLYAIEFYNVTGDPLIRFVLPTGPEPNCTLSKPIRENYKFVLKADYTKHWRDIYSFRLSPLPFNSIGWCKRN